MFNRKGVPPCGRGVLVVGPRNAKKKERLALATIQRRNMSIRLFVRPTCLVIVEHVISRSMISHREW